MFTFCAFVPRTMASEAAAADDGTSTEPEDEVVLDVATNPWSALATFFDLDKMVNHPSTDREDADSVMKRVRLNLKTRQTSVEDWPSLPGSPVWTNTVDFPVLNDKMYGYKNR